VLDHGNDTIREIEDDISKLDFELKKWKKYISNTLKKTSLKVTLDCKLSKDL
jgi:hypothetical protein